jgi:hypothetical protein
VSLVISWLLFPLVFAGLAFGCGLLVEAAARVQLPFALLLPVGFALIVCVAGLATMSSTTTAFATPAVVACAVVGAVVSATRLRPRVWPLAAASAAFAAYASPTVFTGRATFAGYIKLDDTATYLAMLDRVMTHGRSLAGLAPSTYEATLATSLDYGYPVGSLMPLGVVHQLFGTDAAWLWQPYVAVLGALLALALYGLVAPLVRSRPLRAAGAVIAAQPAVLFGYSLWGGIKEIAAAMLIATAAALLAVAVRGTPRAIIPFAVVAAALLGVLSLGGAAWLVPLLLAAAAVLFFARGRGFLIRAAGVFAVVAAVLSIPPIVTAVDWLPRSTGFTSSEELGNLLGPLRWLQVFGIWPVGDFRRSPDDLAPTYVLIAVAGVAALAGIVCAIRRRRWEIVAYAATAAIGALAIVVAGSPWVGAKAIAIAAPAVLVLALVGCAALVSGGRLVEAGVVALAIAGGVLWSNVLAYEEAWLAPRARLVELERIGERYAGQGPALLTEYEPYGARHFLRRLDAEGASELRRRLVALQSGSPVVPQGYVDVDRIRLSDVLAYRTLVLRRSPVESIPPSSYRLVSRGQWYDVWQQRASPRVLEHLSLGSELDPAAVPSCASVTQLAKTPGATQLLAVARGPVAVASLGEGIYPDADRTIVSSVDLREANSYRVWVGGSFVGRIGLRVDGHELGSSRHQLEWTGQFVPLGRIPLTAGPHRIELTYNASGVRPGSRGVAPFPLGPLVVAPEEDARTVAVAPSQARALCGRRFDWIEAVR